MFADKHVRQAMTMLIDRDAICKQIFAGYATPAVTCFAPGSKQARSESQAMAVRS